MTARLASILGSGTILSPTEVVYFLVLGSALSFLVVSGGLSLAAVGMRREAAKRGATVAHREAAWKTRLHEVLYGDGSEEELWSTVDERDQLAFLHFLVEYARRLHGDERQQVCSLAAPYLHRLRPFLARRSETRRARAVQMLGELGLPTHASIVIQALDDPSPMVSMVAASTLARTETAEYAIEVLRRLNRFTHWRQDFLAAMITSMGAEASPALREIVSDDSEPPKVRAVAADALANSSDPEAADLAVEILGSTDDLELRAAALRLLASVGRDVHLPVVRASLDADEPLPVRLAAIRALGRFGWDADVDSLVDAAKNDPSPWVAIAAARALKEGGGVTALEALAGSDHPRAALGLQVISEARSW